MQFLINKIQDLKLSEEEINQLKQEKSEKDEKIDILEKTINEMEMVLNNSKAALSDTAAQSQCFILL